MEEYRFEYLDWDSNFFQRKVAKISSDVGTEPELQTQLSILKKEGYELVYWSAAPTVNISKAFLTSVNGKLVDKKVTYLMDLTKNPSEKQDLSHIKEYTEEIPNKTLEHLAIESGEYSRYKVDPNFTREQFENLYKLWISNSTSKKIAQKVLIYEEKAICLGTITLGTKSQRGDIGLLAVDKTMRSKGIGKLLVIAAKHYFFELGYKQLQVVTQEANIGACRFYENCGFRKEKTEHFYHFWLRSK